MTEKKEVQVAEYEYSDEEFDSIDHEIAMEDVDDEYNDKPCISTCCCCCNLGLGSIMAGVIFMILNAIYIGRQMTSLNESLADGNTMDNLQFNDGHLDTIFAFVGIALASISGLTAFGLMTLSCCCGVAEHVSRVKIAAFSWTVATGLGSIWVLGEALYRTFQEEDESQTKGLGYIIINDINNVENPEEDRLQDLIITWIIAGAYLLLYIYLSVVVMSFVHVLSRTSVLSQSEQLAKRQGIKQGSPDLSMHSEAALMQRAYSYGGFNNPAFQQPQQQDNGANGVPTLSEQVMAQQNYPEMMQQQQHMEHEQMYQQQMPQPVLPPMFQETIIAGPQGEPVNVVIDTTTGQIVPPEIVQQIMMDSMYMQQQQMAQMAQSECNSVITDCTYRSGAALLNNQQSMNGAPVLQMPQPIQQQPIHMQRQRSVRSVTFNEEPQTRYIEPIASPEPATSSEDDCRDSNKGVRFSLYTEEVEVAPYPAEQKIQHIPPCSSESD